MKVSWGKRFSFPGDTAAYVMEKLFSRIMWSLGKMTIILWAWGYQMVHRRLSGRLWEPPPGNVIISWRGSQSSRLQWAATPSSHLWCAKLTFGEKTTDEVDVCMVSGSSWPVNIHYILSLLFNFNDSLKVFWNMNSASNTLTPHLRLNFLQDTCGVLNYKANWLWFSSN